MTDTKRSVARCVALISATFGAKFPVGDQLLPVWATLFADVPAHELEAATVEWCRTEKWPPTPAELRAKCPSLCRCGSCTACSQRRRALDAAEDDARAIRFAEQAKMLRTSGEWDRLHKTERANLEAWERRAVAALAARKDAPQLEAHRPGPSSMSDLARALPQRREA